MNSQQQTCVSSGLCYHIILNEDTWFRSMKRCKSIPVDDPNISASFPAANIVGYIGPVWAHSFHSNTTRGTVTQVSAQPNVNQTAISAINEDRGNGYTEGSRPEDGETNLDGDVGWPGGLAQPHLDTTSAPTLPSTTGKFYASYAMYVTPPSIKYIQV